MTVLAASAEVRAVPPQSSPDPPRPHADRHRPSRAEDLAIAGLVPLSTVDRPGALVATVFCQGCPWRCAYCHNQEILDPRTPGAIPFARLADLLARRRGLLDGVVLSGGEACLQPAVVPAARRIREAGFSVGLHTGGAYPRRLAALLDPRGGPDGRALVDWVGLDLKAPPGRYAATVGTPGGTAAWGRVRVSLDLLRASGIAHEVRTTLTPDLLPAVADLLGAARAHGVRALVLQQARAEGAPAPFARQLTAQEDWDGAFAAAVRTAAAQGARIGLEVTSR